MFLSRTFSVNQWCINPNIIVYIYVCVCLTVLLYFERDVCVCVCVCQESGYLPFMITFLLLFFNVCACVNVSVRDLIDFNPSNSPECHTELSSCINYHSGSIL